MTAPSDDFIHRFTNTLLNQSDFICWPHFGHGNTLHRICVAHSDYLYNPHWNDWGSDLASPLIPSRTVEECTAIPGFYGAAHYASVLGNAHDWQAENQSLYHATAQMLQTSLQDVKNKQWAATWLKHSHRFRFVYPVERHYTAQFIALHTTRPIIHLYCKSKNTILRRDARVHWESLEGHMESDIVQHPQILNCAIEDLFFSDFNTFAQEYERIRTHFSLKENLLEQVWGFVLYYRDRDERYITNKCVDL